MPSYPETYTLSLLDALPICSASAPAGPAAAGVRPPSPAPAPRPPAGRSRTDRKSTRLNSSHANISYAVLPRDLHSFPTRRSSDLFGIGTRWTRSRRRSATVTSSCSPTPGRAITNRSEEHTSELQSRQYLVCRLTPRPTLFPYSTLFRSVRHRHPLDPQPQAFGHRHQLLLPDPRQGDHE